MNNYELYNREVVKINEQLYIESLTEDNRQVIENNLVFHGGHTVFQSKPQGHEMAMAYRESLNPSKGAIEDLARILGTGGIVYPGLFCDGELKIKNWVGSHLIIIDYDEGEIPLEENLQKLDELGILPKFAYHSWSHGLEGKGHRYKMAWKLADFCVIPHLYQTYVRLLQIVLHNKITGISNKVEVRKGGEDKSNTNLTQPQSGSRHGIIYENYKGADLNLATLCQAVNTHMYVKYGNRKFKEKTLSIVCEPTRLRYNPETGAVLPVFDVELDKEYKTFKEYRSLGVVTPVEEVLVLHGNWAVDLKYMTSRCNLLQEFESGDLDHLERFHLATSLYWAKGGRTKVKKIFKEHYSDNAQAKEDAIYRRWCDTLDFPSPCSNFCPYHSECNPTGDIYFKSGYEYTQHVALHHERMTVDGIQGLLQDNYKNYNKAIHVVETGVGKTHAIVDRATESIISAPTVKLLLELYNRNKAKETSYFLCGLPQLTKSTGEVDTVIPWLHTSWKPIITYDTWGEEERAYQDFLDIYYECSRNGEYGQVRDMMLHPSNYIKGNSKYKQNLVTYCAYRKFVLGDIKTNSANNVFCTHRGLLDIIGHNYAHKNIIIDEDPIKSVLMGLGNIPLTYVKDTTWGDDSLITLELRNLIMQGGGRIAQFTDKMVKEYLENVDNKEYLTELRDLITSDYFMVVGAKIMYINHKKLPLNEGVRCHILSATADEQVCKDFLGEEFAYVLYPQPIIRGKVYQDTSKTYSMSAMSKILDVDIESKDFDIEVTTQEVNTILEKCGDKPVITHKKFADILELMGVEVPMWYGNTEGRDDLKGQEIVCIGTPRLNDHVLRLILTYLGEDYKDKRIDFQHLMGVGHLAIGKWYQPKDKLARAYANWYTRSEIAQAIGRSRFTREETGVTHLYSDFPIGHAIRHTTK